VNKQPIAEVDNGAYQSGQIGLAADEDNNTADVVYNNVQVWKNMRSPHLARKYTIEEQ